ncbi:MAG: M28 family metallopeptidase [Chitinophagaceae bacterium]
MARKLLLILLFNPALLWAQNKAERLLKYRLEQDLYALTTGIPGGRCTGTSGELLAAQFLARQFKMNGLLPMGNSGGYFQPFQFGEGNEIKSTTFLKINGQNIPVGKGFLPLPFSANSLVTGDPLVGVEEQQSPWIIRIRKFPFPSKDSATLLKLLWSKAREAEENGATAVIFYSSQTTSSGLKFDPWEPLSPLKLPVFYIRRAVAKQFFQDESAIVHLEGKIEVGKKISTGQNVLGFWDNHAPNTIIIGAHYDHPGWDSDYLLNPILGFYRTPAEDNAPGTTALIELSRLLRLSRFRKSNYLFIGFSGEEYGLLGSSYFIQHPTLDLKKVKYMIDLNLCDTLDLPDCPVEIHGTFSSPRWADIFHQLRDKKLQISLDTTLGPVSDHDVFFLKNIPVLELSNPQSSLSQEEISHSVHGYLRAGPEILNYLTKLIDLSNKTDNWVFSPGSPARQPYQQ